MAAQQRRQSVARRRRFQPLMQCPQPLERMCGQMHVLFFRCRSEACCYRLHPHGNQINLPAPFQEKARKCRGEQAKFRSRGGIGSEERELAFLEIGDADICTKLGRQEILNQAGESAQLLRLDQ